MCIDDVSDITKRSGVGWKAFILKDGDLHSVFHPLTPSYPIGRWIRENDFRDKKTRYKKGVRVPCWAKKANYPLGFHIFLSKNEALRFAKNEVVRRVKYRKAHTKGTFNFFKYVENAKTIVAKEMKIDGED